MKLATVGNGTAIHIYTETHFPEMTTAGGRVVESNTHRNSLCGAVEVGAWTNSGRRNRKLNIIEGEAGDVTCKRCIKSQTLEDARAAAEEEAEAPVAEEAPAPGLQAVAKFTAVDSTIIERGHHYKVIKRWVATNTGNLRVSVENEHGLVTTFGYPAEETPLPAPVRARDAIYGMSMAAANREVVTQGHSDYCASHGHARYFIAGGAANQEKPFCPRCGDRTIPVTEAIEVDKNGPGRYEVFETLCTGERRFLGTMHHHKASDEWVARKANGHGALINNKLGYKGPEHAAELALYVGWWN